MKQLPILLSLTLTIGWLFTGCNTDEEQSVPDAMFNVGITGDVSQTHGFTITDNTTESQNSNGSEVITCIYTPALNEFSMIAQEQSAAWSLALTYSGELEPGTYSLSQSGYVNPSQSNQAFDGISGTITISQVESLQSSSYSIDGSFSASMETSTNPTESIQVDGTFTNVTAKSIQ